jgi:hypothetical protein
VLDWRHWKTPSEATELILYRHRRVLTYYYLFVSQVNFLFRRSYANCYLLQILSLVTFPFCTVRPGNHLPTHVKVLNKHFHMFWPL